ncbi:GH16 domain-containing protein [Mycena kentingensis (nom. inval.)]|nr:GH16 domain-containing protein [Mycena kentingensis (nom. inval.)]
MIPLLLAALFSLATYPPTSRAAYFPLYDFSGSTFFDGFDFYGAIDNTTWGNVSYVTAEDAAAESLAYINTAGNAILRVDNTSTVLNTGTVQYRKSVRLTSKAAFDVGTLFVVDAVHMPFGCSVWPSIWLNGVLEEGQVWPQAGEMDLVEAINLMERNQMALHSYEGCVQPQNVAQLGTTLKHDCNDTTASGCTVAETKANSYGPGFNNAGGGAFALQFDVAGVFMWFWSRADIPQSILESSADQSTGMSLTDWGPPSAAYPAGPGGCNITQFFPAQQLVLDITLCGLWAGIPEIYAEDCQGSCVHQIAGNGSNYADAYFEIPFIRTWTVSPGVAASVAASASSASSSSAAEASQTAGGGGALATGAGTGTALGMDWMLGLQLAVWIWIGIWM